MRKSINKMKDLFWLSFSDMSVHGSLVTSLLSSGKAEQDSHHMAQQSCSLHDGQENKRSGQEQDIPFRDMLPLTYFLQIGSIS